MIKKQYFLLYLLLCITHNHLSVTSDSNKTQQESFTVRAGDIHIHNATGNATAMAKQKQRTMVKTEITTLTIVHTVDLGISQKLSEVSQKIDTLYQQTHCLISNNKLKIAGLTAAIAYTLITYQLYRTNQILTSHDSWCNWKSIIPLQHLMLTSHKDINQQLTIDIQKKYYYQSDQASSCNRHFLNALQEEIIHLSNYLKLYNIFKTLYISKLFYFTSDPIIIEEKLTRLYFILDVFTTTLQIT